MTEKKHTGPDLDYVCFLGQGSLIKDNTFITSSHLKITGLIELDVECKGNLVISSAGLVMGNISADNVHVYGKVQGNIKAANNVHLYKGAEVVGQINCDFLKVEEGTSCRIDAQTGEHADPKNNELMQKTGARYNEKKASLEKEFRNVADQPLQKRYTMATPLQNGSAITLVQEQQNGSGNGHNGHHQTNGSAAPGEHDDKESADSAQNISTPLRTGHFSPEDEDVVKGYGKTAKSKKPLFF